jgi:hypothetical protein
MTTQEQLNTRPPVIYIGFFLDGKSREKLLQLVPPRHSKVFADHCTLVFRPSASDITDFLKGPMRARKEISVIGTVHDEKGQAVLVADVVSKNTMPHITISCADGVKPVYSNELLERGTVEYFSALIVLTGTIDGYPRNLTLETGESNG